MKAVEEFVINQIYGLFDFIRTIGTITQFFERTTPLQRTDQSQRGLRTHQLIKPAAHLKHCQLASIR